MNNWKIYLETNTNAQVRKDQIDKRISQQSGVKALLVREFKSVLGDFLDRRPLRN